MSFLEFTRKRLFEPLGMKMTNWRDDFRDVVKNRALAYEKQGDGWKLAMPLENYYGGGGLLSTTSDLLIWNEALTSGRLSAFVSEKLQEQTRLNNGRQIAYARGLIVESHRGFKEVRHSGGAAGYHSWLARYPEQGLSIAPLCNSDAVSTRTLAHSVIDQFLPAVDSKAAEAKAPAAIADGTGAVGLDVSSKAGLFVSERTGEPLRLIVDGARLRIAGRPALTAVTEDRFRNPSSDLFFMSQDQFELHFLSRDQFEMKSMEGKSTRYRRAEPYAPTSADLRGFVGRYESDEVGSVYQITAGRDGVVMRREGSPDKGWELKPAFRDTFQRGPLTVRFHRDKAGKVVALGFSGPQLRDLRFTRLSDLTNRR